MYFRLDEKRRCVDDEVGPVLLVLAALDELGVEVAVPPGLPIRERPADTLL